MKVLAYLHLYIPGNRAGGEMMLHGMLKALVDRGHDVTAVLTHTHGAPYEVDGVRVVPQGHSLLRSGGWDVLISHFAEAPKGLIFARRFRKPGIVVVHNSFAQTGRQVAQGWSLRVFNTDWLSRHWSRFPGPRLVVHPPINPAVEASPGDRVTLVNPIPAKGAELFYSLAEHLPAARFLVVEGGYMHPQQVFRDLPNVIRQPHTGNMGRDVYSRSRVVLMPSVYESYGMVAAEAAVCGIPVIANPTPGLQEALGDAGIFVPLDEPDRWRAELERLLHDQGWWSAVSARIAARGSQIIAQTGPELDAWVDAVEETVARGVNGYTRAR